MANRLTPLGMVLKWLIAPIAVGAIGYYLVGPRVDAKVAPDLIKSITPGIEAKPDANEPDPKTVQRSFSAPEVDVTVTALNRREERPKRRRRKRASPKVETPAVAPNPVEAAPPEPPPTDPPVVPPNDGDGA
jgi:hypothetical protein